MNNTPKHIQIHDQLLSDINEGKWNSGEKLPSERELSTNFNVSRMTLRQAIQSLVDEGKLEKRLGSGTFVSKKKVQEKLSDISGFSTIINNQGSKPSSHTISYMKTNPTIAEQKALKIHSSVEILRMERVRFADSVPICYEVTSVPYEMINGSQKKQVTDSLYKEIEKNTKLMISSTFQTISSMLSSEKIANYLKIEKNDPILRLQQISILDNGKPCEYVTSQYVGNRFEFVLKK